MDHDAITVGSYYDPNKPRDCERAHIVIGLHLCYYGLQYRILASSASSDLFHRSVSSASIKLTHFQMRLTGHTMRCGLFRIAKFQTVFALVAAAAEFINFSTSSIFALVSHFVSPTGLLRKQWLQPIASSSNDFNSTGFQWIWPEFGRQLCAHLIMLTI